MEAVPDEVRLRERRQHNLHELAWQPVPAATPATLDYFMRDYVNHLHHHLRQIDETMTTTPSVECPCARCSRSPARPRAPRRPRATTGPGSVGRRRPVWPTGKNCPTRGAASAAANIRWKIAVPGLAHSSPIVWGDRIFVTSAISSRADVTFKPGLYGEGTASEDRTAQKWVVMALDRATGKTVWTETAYEGVPKEKRHIKATYANATPFTDGRYVVAFFGSQGLYAFDMKGRPRVAEGSRRAQHRRLRSAGVRVGHGQLADHLQGSRHRAVRHAERIVRDGVEREDGEDRVEDGSQGTAVVGHADRVPAAAAARPSS